MKKFIRVFGVLTLSVVFTTQFGLAAVAKTGDVSTWLGALYRGDGGDANNAFLDTPFGFTADSQCNLYVADTNDNVIRYVDKATNVISTFAGTGQYGNKNGLRKKANFATPYDIEYGPDGELYVLDTGNKSVRIVRNGSVTTWLTGLKSPVGSYLDGTTLYISETGNNRIVKATIPSGTKSTVASITDPGKLTMNGGILYVIHADGTTLAKVNVATGAVTDIKTDFIDALSATVYNDEVYIVAGWVGTYNEIWKYTPATGAMVKLQSVIENNTFNFASDILFCGGRMYLLFKGGSSVYSADLDGSNPLKVAGVDRFGNRDGSKSVLMLGRPKSLAFTKDRTKVYILENHVFKIYDLKTQTLTFIAGFARDGYKDFAGASARMSVPMQIALAPDEQSIYFVDRNNNRIRKLTISTQQLSTVTGSGLANALGGERNAYAEGADCHENFEKGVAGCAYFDQPSGLAISADGKTLYISDTENNRIRTVEVATGATQLLVGSGVAGLKDGIGSKARFKLPVSLALAKDGNTLYVLEKGNHDLRKIDLKSRRVTKILGSGKAGYRDGLFKNSRLSYPDSVTLGQNKSILYISDGGTKRVRKVDLKKGIISTLAGNGNRGYVNGPGTKAQFSNPRGMALLSSRTLLVTDQTNDLIRAIKL